MRPAPSLHSSPMTAPSPLSNMPHRLGWACTFWTSTTPPPPRNGVLKVYPSPCPLPCWCLCRQVTGDRLPRLAPLEPLSLVPCIVSGRFNDIRTAIPRFPFLFHIPMTSISRTRITICRPRRNQHIASAPLSLSSIFDEVDEDLAHCDCDCGCAIAKPAIKQRQLFAAVAAPRSAVNHLTILANMRI